MIAGRDQLVPPPPTPPTRGQRPGGPQGQALAEAAVALIVLLLLFSAIIDFGRAFFTYLALHNAAAEGAYYGAAFPTDVGTYNGTDTDTIIFRAKHESPSQLVNWATPGVSITVQLEPDRAPNPPDVGDHIKVNITYPFRLIGPLPGLLGWDGEITLYAQATQTILTRGQ